MRIFLTPTNDIRSAMALIVASGDPGLIELSDGTFQLAGSGTKSNLNGAAIINNTALNPSGVPITIRGQGQGITTLRLADGNPFNLVEVVSISGGYAELPFELSHLTLDGNGANQAQDPDPLGDRYQNCLYACGVRGLRLSDVEVTGASYHGMALNSCHEARTRVTARFNYCNGVLLTGNPSAGMYGEAGEHDLLVVGNGISQPGQADTTYMGVIIIAQNGVRVRAVSRWHRNHSLNAITPHSGGAALMHTSVGCNVDILSRGDRSALLLGQGVQDSDINVSGTLCDVVGVQEASTVSGDPIRGNTFRMHLRGCPVTADFGNGLSNVEENTFYGGRLQGPFVRGPKFMTNNDIHGWQ